MLKLVRDKIPEILRAQGLSPNIKIIHGEAYLDYLFKKLEEEVNEFILDPSVEELADILEVIYGLQKCLDWDLPPLKETKKNESINLIEVIDELLIAKSNMLKIPSIELAENILNLVCNLANKINVSILFLEEIRKKKLEERGGFENGILFEMSTLG